jgi:uncharacterized damage-inducible protein DinB
MTADGERFLAETIDLLDRTPRLLRDLLGGLPESWLAGRDTSDGWTAHDVLGHLISGELDDWIPRAEIILRDGETRPFVPFDRFAHLERDRAASVPELLDRFADLRAASLERLSALVTAADLDRTGRHPELGTVTMRQLIATWAVHDLDHVGQVYAALAATRDAAVGPWKAYLGILLRRDEAAG